jgi:biopolymer transport protein ExbD
MLSKRAISSKNFCTIDVMAFGSVMIVLMFLLLIPQLLGNHHDGGVSVDQPRVRHTILIRETNGPRPLLVVITREEKVFFGKDQIVPDHLAAVIQRAAGSGAEKRVYIRADSRTRYGNVVSALDGVRSAGTSGLDGTEFSGGRITGPLLDTCELGMLAFVIALVVLYWFLRHSASIALGASLCCLPLPLYFFAPGRFRTLFKGEWSVPLSSSFVWTRWTIIPIAVILATMTAAALALLRPRTLEVHR